MCTSVGRLRWLPVGPHLRRGVYANTTRLALLQDPAAPRVYATLEIAGVCGSGHERPVPPGGCETAPCFDQRAMSLERGSGLGQVLLGSSRGSNECFCISPRDPHLSALSDGPTMGQMDLVCLGHQLPCSTVEGYEVVQRYVQ